VQLERIDDPAALRAAFIRHGVWVRPFRDIVYLTPALTIEPGRLSDLCQAVVKVVNSTTAIKTGTAPNS